MVRTFLVRGMLVGIVAGLLSFAFLKIYGEPQVDRAVAFEIRKMKQRPPLRKRRATITRLRPTITCLRPTCMAVTMSQSL